jgi:DNA-binding NarL/FixJ family response regulator
MTKDRILFVDDEPLILEALKRMLRRYVDQWDMTFVDGPKDAQARFAEAGFDVVVSDLQMPGLNGLDLVKSMREQDATAQFIILTGTADLDTAIEAINEAGIFRFYTKPCPADRLAEGVKAALLERRRRVNSSGVGAAGTQGLGEAALNRLPVAVVVVDAQAQLAFMNPRGAEMIAQRDGLVLGYEQVLRAADPDDTAELHAMIKALANPGGEMDTQAMALERPSMARALTIRAEPMPTDGAAGESGLVILFITDPERPPQISAEIVARIFGLTESESRVAAAIAQGATLEEAAASMNLTVSTVRTYLKQVFSKTDTSRQAELVKMILVSPAAV